jgi:DNA-binding CsgD family transcriptional regulator
MVSDEPTTQRPWRRGGIVSRRQPVVLSVLTGAHRGARFELDRGEHVIGRGEHVDIRIDDSGVSREHAKLVWTEQGVVNLIDLRSTNGTAVNGARVDVTVLRPGDRIQLGPEVELWFGHEPPEPQRLRQEQAAARLRKLLSARQLQVARLVAEGLSNREVAERLSIRVRTVESHLDNIYGALAIGSRSALTRAVVEAGLLGP